MLSILIPTYNYNAFPLAQELEKQALALGIPFELICIDDGSFSPLNEENQKINSLTNCHFIENRKNLGRSGIRNLLADKARYEWLLFFDSDVFPKSKDLIKNYIEAQKSSDSKVFYGGILYSEKLPSEDSKLRWVYGKKREALPVEKRKEMKYLRFLTLCFLIKKEIFNHSRFNESIKNLRHEDTLFALDLKKNHINITHIDNPVYHLGLEKSEVFLKKSRDSIEGLLEIIKSGLMPANHVLISKAHRLSKLFFTHKILSYIYTKHREYLERNLLSENPSLFLFDLYRLCYLCYLDNSK